jgi:hypothetical protein
MASPCQRAGHHDLFARVAQSIGGKVSQPKYVIPDQRPALATLKVWLWSLVIKPEPPVPTPNSFDPHASQSTATVFGADLSGMRCPVCNPILLRPEPEWAKRGNISRICYEGTKLRGTTKTWESKRPKVIFYALSERKRLRRVTSA